MQSEWEDTEPAIRRVGDFQRMEKALRSATAIVFDLVPEEGCEVADLLIKPVTNADGYFIYRGHQPVDAFESGAFVSAYDVVCHLRKHTTETIEVNTPDETAFEHPEVGVQ